MVDYSIRTNTIHDGVNSDVINLTSGGPLPKVMLTFLMDPAGFHGDFELCATFPGRHHLESYEIMIDNAAVPGMPITCAPHLVTQPYVEFLKTAKWFDNGLSGKVLKMSEYENCNFIMAYDLQNIRQDEGWLSMRLKFDTSLPEKLMLITLLINTKTLIIDKDGMINLE